MRRAFVLISSDPGAEDEVLKAVEEIPEVREAYQLHGVYDIIIQVEAETVKELNDIVVFKIRNLDKVRARAHYMKANYWLRDGFKGSTRATMFKRHRA